MNKLVMMSLLGVVLVGFVASGLGLGLNKRVGPE